MADFVAISLRGLAIAAALQAAGVPVFIWLFGRDLERSSIALRALAVRTALTGFILTLAHAIVAPARLTGELAGMTDMTLQAMLLASDAGTALAVRGLGLALVLAGALRGSRNTQAAALLGAALIAVSFAFMGHTAADDRRWLLAPALIVHLLAIAFWLGSLLPLTLVSRLEDPSVAGATIERFSQSAVRLVPMILIAGVVMAGVLLPDFSSLATPYGVSVMAKSAGFALLMVLAAANKWRFGPGIAAGKPAAAKMFRRCVFAEWFLILIVVLVTAVMTALFSPER